MASRKLKSSVGGGVNLDAKLETNDKPVGGLKGLLMRITASSYYNSLKRGVIYTQDMAWTASNWGGKKLWVYGTMAAITLLPLIMEIDREQTMIEAEEQQRAMMMAQGYTPQQIEMMSRQR